MAKELRDIIALEERFSANNFEATTWLKFLRGQIDLGFRKGYLRDRLPEVTSESLAAARSETEPPTIFRTFTEQEREILLADGAVLYLPTGKTINDQRAAGREFWYVAPGFMEEGKNRLTEFPSRRIEVAIYPAPERFFVPGSFDKTMGQQDEASREDAKELRKRLGLKGIEIVRPEASEVTEVMFEHFDATRVRLLGEEYREQAAGHWPYIRTNTPTDKSGSCYVWVGSFDPNDGPDVDVWLGDDHLVFLGVARWVVPMDDR